MNSLISIRNLIRRDVCIGSNTGMYSCAANNIWAAATSFIPSHSMNMNTTGTDIICDERRLGGIRGAKKKAGGSSTNGRNSAGRRLGIKVWPNKFASEFFLWFVYSYYLIYDIYLFLCWSKLLFKNCVY